MECSPACHAGGRGFKSHRGRLIRHGAPIGRAAKLKPWRLGVRIPLVLLNETHASAGHWRAAVFMETGAVTHPLPSCAGSTPARRTDNMARSSNGRMRAPQARDTGSTPVRAADIAKWRNWYTRDVQNVVSASDMRVRLSPWRLTKHDADAAGAQRTFIRSVCPARYRDLQLATLRVGQCSSEPHKL